MSRRIEGLSACHPVWRFCTALLAILSIPISAQADPSSTTQEKGYDLGEIHSPRSLALGGAQAALGSSTTGLYLNPANLALARVYHFEGLAAFGPEARRQSYGGAVVDSVLNRYRLAGGLGGTWSIMDPDGIRRTWTDLRVGMAYPLGDRLSIGLGGRYLRVDQAVASGPLGASLASDGTRDKTMFNELTFDAGATVVISEALRLGAVGKNLTNPGTSLAPTTLQGGLGFMTKDVAIEANGMLDFTTFRSTKMRLMVGGELFLADRFALRLGYRFDDGTKAHAISAGAGYIDRKWSIEIGARRDIAGDRPSTLMNLSLRYFYDAVGVRQDEPDAF
jgi:opacity protein-like surface antigen